MEKLHQLLVSCLSQVGDDLEILIISLQAGYERPNAKDTLAGQADTDEMGDVFLGEDAKTGTQIRRAMQKNESTSH